MTTIAYRDGVMAADTQASGDGIADCTVVKIARNDKGDLAGSVGDCGYNSRFLSWFSSGEKYGAPAIKEESQHNEAMIVRASGEIELFDQGGTYTVTAPYYSVGSGKPLALGAMAYGANAEESVKAAIRHDIYSGGDITVLEQKGH